MDQTPTGHQPVMPEEVAAAFAPVPAGTIIDATFGGGGHSLRLLEAAGPDRRILAIDQDPTVTPPSDDRIKLVTANFRRLRQIAEEQEIAAVTGVLFDLGFSSIQMDDPARGLGYRQEGPLDMRLGGSGASAADLVNSADTAELTRIIADFGEDPVAGRIARAIVAARPISTTTELARVVSEAVPAALKRRRHPARRTFQALRIAVNDELEALRSGLVAALDLVIPGGRVAVLSYHSLEDRIVKNEFRTRTDPDDSLMPVPTVQPTFRAVTRGADKPTDAEVEANPRARSARFRVVERI